MFLILFALEEIKDRRVNNIVEHILTSQIDICNWRHPPRGGREEEELINLRSELEGAEFSNQVDCLQWSITDSGIYTVKSRRNVLDNLILPSNGDEFELNELIPIKVNILFWRVSLNMIPAKLNLHNKGIICPSGLISPQDLSLESIWCFVSPARLEGLVDTVLDAVFRSIIWLIWSCRNDKVFEGLDTSHASPFILFRKLQALVFDWVVSRCKKLSLVWTELCRFSGQKIYLGRGIRFIRSDSQDIAQEAVKKRHHATKKPYSRVVGATLKVIQK
nr:hypothetical protein [Tanacetum cinerariifolium]